MRPAFVLGDAGACAAAASSKEVSPVLAASFTLLLIALFSGANLYRSRLVLSLLDDIIPLVKRWALAVSVVGVVTQVADVGRQLWTFALTALTAVIVVRALNYSLVHRLRGGQMVSHPTLVVGSDETCRRLVNNLQRDPRCGLRPLGFLDIVADDVASLPAPLLGAPVDLVEMLDTLSPNVLILGQSSLPERDMVTLVRACHRNRCEVFVIPRLYELHHVAVDVEYVWDIPLVRLRRAAYRSRSWRLKRPFDLAFALVALVVLAPLMLVCALAVYREGGPGVIFRQERIGCDGRRFSLLKFRTLRPVSEEESETLWNISHDGRLGPVGRLMRVASLDELPQLANVLRGEMSLVGPRPERPHFVQQFGELYLGYSARQRVPSGLTGWAQVHGLRGDTSISDRVRFDNFYIENWSLWLDFKILLLTTISVFRSPGS